jgi:hypothetical protein
MLRFAVLRGVDAGIRSVPDRRGGPAGTRAGERCAGKTAQQFAAADACPVIWVVTIDGQSRAHASLLLVTDCLLED